MLAIKKSSSEKENFTLWRQKEALMQAYLGCPSVVMPQTLEKKKIKITFLKPGFSCFHSLGNKLRF